VKVESIGSLDVKIAAGIESPEDWEQDVYEAEEVKETLIKKTTRLKRYLEINKPSSEINGTGNVAQSSSASRLPKLNLPMFFRDPIKWQFFWDSFEAVVHTNANLTGMKKFNYLRAQLEGDAARTVSGFCSDQHKL